MISKEEMQQILADLSNKHKWFYSEASFRQELSNCINEYYRNKGERDVVAVQEYSFPVSPYESLDILVKFPDRKYTAIELKYKTDDCAMKDDNDQFYILKKQSAENISMYLFWKDVFRLEHFSLNDARIMNGYAIFLTNCPIYRTGGSNKAKARKEFELCEDKNFGKDAILCWRSSDGKTVQIKHGYEKPIHLIEDYKKYLIWNDFILVEDKIRPYSYFPAEEKAARKPNGGEYCEIAFDILSVHIDCAAIRKELWKKQQDARSRKINLFTAGFIYQAAEAEFSVSIYDKARKNQVLGENDVLDYMKDQYDKVVAVNQDNAEYKFDLSRNELAEAVRIEVRKLSGEEYYGKNKEFMSFLETARSKVVTRKSKSRDE